MVINIGPKVKPTKVVIDQEPAILASYLVNKSYQFIDTNKMVKQDVIEPVYTSSNYRVVNPVEYYEPVVTAINMEKIVNKIEVSQHAVEMASKQINKSYQFIDKPVKTSKQSKLVTRKRSKPVNSSLKQRVVSTVISGCQTFMKNRVKRDNGHLFCHKSTELINGKLPKVNISETEARYNHVQYECYRQKRLIDDSDELLALGFFWASKMA